MALTKLGLVREPHDLDRIDGYMHVTERTLRILFDGSKMHMNVNASLRRLARQTSGMVQSGTFPNLVFTAAAGTGIKKAVQSCVKNATAAARGSPYMFKGRKAPVHVIDFDAMLKSAEEKTTSAATKAAVRRGRVVEMGAEGLLPREAPRLLALDPSEASHLDLSVSYVMSEATMRKTFHSKAPSGPDPLVCAFTKGPLGTGVTVYPIFQTMEVLSASPGFLLAGCATVSTAACRRVQEYEGVVYPQGVTVEDIVYYSEWQVRTVVWRVLSSIQRGGCIV